MSHQAASMVWFENDGAAALFTCDCDTQALIYELAGLLERPHVYDAVGDTESANAWKLACSKTWTPRASGTNTWGVRFDAICRIDAGFDVDTRLVVDDSYYHELPWPDGANWRHCSGVALVPLDQSSHTIAVEFRSATAAQTASIKEISLYARMLKQ